MKLYKGKLNFYAATGEIPHYYCYTGEDTEQHDWVHHVVINESDVVEVISPDKKVRIVIYYFPNDMDGLKQILKKKGFAAWKKAVKENWDVEIVKLEVANNYN
jgi:hypothetical protein